MHELSIARQLLGTVEDEARKAGAERVVAVNLRLGERSHVSTDSLSTYFEHLVVETSPCHGAELRVSRIPMRFECLNCLQPYPVRGGDFRCPNCRGLGRMIDPGDQLLVESLEVEA